MDSLLLGVGNYTSTGIIPNSKLNRTTVRLSGESKQSNWLTVGGSVAYTNTQGTRVQNGSTLGGTMLTLLRAPINYNIKNYYNPVTNEETRYYALYDNPMFVVNDDPYNDQTNRIFGTAYARAKLSDNWSINLNAGTDMYTTDSRQVFAYSSLGDDQSLGLGQVNYSNIYSRNIYSDFIVHYDKYLSEKIQLNAFAGYNFWYLESGSTFTRGENIQVPNFYNLNNFNTLYDSNLAGYERRQGIYGDVTMSYSSYIFLTVTGRNDWTTAFGPNSRSLFYPKADLSWVFTEQIPRNNFLTQGKARIAYSDAGLGPASYTYFKTVYYAAPFITDGNTTGNGSPYLGNTLLAPNNVNNPGGLVPADNESVEGGLELAFFKNRVTLDAVVYNQVSHNNLITQPVAPSSGFQYSLANAGDVRNRGVELDLGIDVLKSKNFNWHVGGNFTKNVSKVLDISSGVSSISIEQGFSDIGSYAIVGQPYGVFYGTAWARDPKNGKILVNADGTAQVSDQSKVIGNPNPKWLMNISNSFTFKGFNFSFLIDIRHGGDIWDGTVARLNRIGISAASANRNQTYIVDGEYAPGTPNAGQKNTTPVSALYYYQTFTGDGGTSPFAVENAIEDGSWVRLRSVNLSYRFNFLKKHPNSNINYLELGVSGRNLILITQYKGVDPETSLTGAGSNISGYDYFNNPGTKSFAINLRMGL